MLTSNFMRKLVASLFSKLWHNRRKVRAPVCRPLPRLSRCRPGLEFLEDRLAPAVQLSYAGTGTALVLTENSSGSTPTISIGDSFTPILTRKNRCQIIFS